MKRYLKYFILFILCFIFILDKPLAQDIEVSDGYAVCTYAGLYKDKNYEEMEKISEDGSFDMSQYETDYYMIYAYAYRENGARRVWGELYKTKTRAETLAGNYIPLGTKTEITNYNSFSNSINNFVKFNDGSSYRCPSMVYVYQNYIYWNYGECLSYAKKNNGKCVQMPKISSVSGTSDKSGKLSIIDAKEGSYRQFSFDAYKESMDKEGIETSTSIADIIKWANDLVSKNNGATEDSGKSGCTLISGELQVLLHDVFFYFSIAGVIILVVMSIMDLIRAITGDVDDALKKFLKGIKARVVSLVILLLLPMIVTFITNTVNNVATISGYNNDNPLCGVIPSSTTTNTVSNDSTTKNE